MNTTFSIIPGWTPLPVASASSASAGPSSSVGAAAAVAAPSTTSVATTNNRRGRRLPPAAREILLSFYNTVSTHPKKQQRIELADAVRQVPGCEDYTEAKVNNFFVNLRNTERNRGIERVAPTSSAHVLYPSLLSHPEILPDVDACLKDLPLPSEPLAQEIAKAIRRRVKGSHVQARDIMTYAKIRLETGASPPPTTPTVSSVSTGPGPSTPPPSPGSLRREQKPPVSNALQQPPQGIQIFQSQFRLAPFERSAPPLRRSQLPTPASSTSPEPRSPVVESEWGKADEEMDDEEDEEDVKDELFSDDDDMPGSEESKQTLVVPPDPRLHALAGDLQESLSRLVSEESRSAPPKTFAELAGWLKEQDTASTAILHRISQGAYAPPGPTKTAPSSLMPK